ncbi:hypothetical protein KI387_015089, partial [Taxus chinensis]
DQPTQRQKQVTVDLAESPHTSPARSSSSDSDSEQLPPFPLENLIGYDCQSHV